MGGLLLWKVLCVRASLRVVFAYRREPAEGSQLVACLAEEDRQWGYALYRPYECFHMLESLAYGLLRTRRPVILPFGPKLFMLNSLLVASVHPEVAVWRFSPGDFEVPVNRIPNGRVAALRASFSPKIPTNDID